MSAIREITLAEVKQHHKPADLWVVIEDKVYDLTKFRSEHPGGEESLDDVAGKNATKEFIEVGHSIDAREMMGKYLIGKVAAADRKNKLPIREIGIAVGAVVIGIATVFIIRQVLANRN